MIRIATYNVNSLRIRLHAVKLLTEQHKPDIICLQETKVQDMHFPADDLRAMGYAHQYISGQKSYNGVAILSKIPLQDVQTMDLLGSDHKRHISARLGDIALHNFYLPAGGDIPDPAVNEKFDFKLKCYDAVTKWCKAQSPKDKLIMVGDMNVAPLPEDVWSHKQLLTVVSHTPVETDAMERMRASLNWVDTSRHFTPTPQKLYSWWSYRNQDWQKSDRGRRLDHIWVTPALAPALASGQILREARSWDNPSDHVPVLLDIKQ